MKKVSLYHLVVGLIAIALLLVGCDEGQEQAVTTVSEANTPVQTQPDVAPSTDLVVSPTVTLSPLPEVPVRPAPPVVLAPVVSLDDLRLPAGSLLQDNLVVLPPVPIFQELLFPAFDGSMESLWTYASRAFALDQENIAFFYAPADLSALEIADFFEGEALRLGGVMVEVDATEGANNGQVVWTRDNMQLTISYERQPGAEWLMSFAFEIKEN